MTKEDEADLTGSRIDEGRNLIVNRFELSFRRAIQL